MNERAKTILKAMETFDALEALPRTGYLLRGVRNAENVAAHCFGTALLAMLLADAEGSVDAQKVLRMALLHEASETLLTDIPRVAKSLLPSCGLEKAEHAAAIKVFAGLEKSDAYVSLVDEYNAQSSREARLVRAADKLQMLCKVRFYEKAGARNLEDFFDNDQGMRLEEFPVAQALLALLREWNPGADR